MTLLAEMTATNRVGFHQYTFPKSDQSHIILDLMHGIYNYDDKNVWTFVRVVNDTLVTGYRQTNGWARTRTVYFAMSFSKPFKEYGQKNFEKARYTGVSGENLTRPKISRKLRENASGCILILTTEDQEKIKIKFALSPVSQDNALANMRAEVPHGISNKLKAQAQADWNKELEQDPNRCIRR